MARRLAGDAPERRACRDDPHRPPLRVARRIDETAQMLGREVGAGGGQSAVERGGGMGAAVTTRPDVATRDQARLCRSRSMRSNLAGKGRWPMNALADRQDNFRSALDPYGAVTHEVINQPVELADSNLYDSDAALKEAVQREGAGWAGRRARSLRRPRRVGRVSGAGRRWPTGTRRNSTPTTATAGASISSASIRPITR